jgi:DNA-binding NtrC family response regulator
MRPITATVTSERVDPEDEALAIQHRLPVLISARCSSTVTRVARRIHVAASSPGAPLVVFPAAELLEQREQFAEQWSMLLHAGDGGSVLLTDIEELPRAAQALLAASLNQPRATASTPAARLITGTTVSLLDRVQSGQFSEDLLYRLNLIHLHRREGCDPCPQCAARR